MLAKTGKRSHERESALSIPKKQSKKLSCRRNKSLNSRGNPKNLQLQRVPRVRFVQLAPRRSPLVLEDSRIRRQQFVQRRVCVPFVRRSQQRTLSRFARSGPFVRRGPHSLGTSGQCALPRRSQVLGLSDGPHRSSGPSESLISSSPSDLSSSSPSDLSSRSPSDLSSSSLSDLSSSPSDLRIQAQSAVQRRRFGLRRTAFRRSRFAPAVSHRASNPGAGGKSSACGTRASSIQRLQSGSDRTHQGRRPLEQCQKRAMLAPVRGPCGQLGLPQDQGLGFNDRDSDLHVLKSNDLNKFKHKFEKSQKEMMVVVLHFKK